MRLRKKFVAAVSSAVLAAALLVGCATGDDTATGSTGSTVTAAATVDASTVDGTQTAAEVLAANKTAHTVPAVSADGAAEITLSGTSASSSSDGVEVNGSTVTISKAGTYRISGSLTDGQIVVNAPDATVTLVLDGADITSSTTAAIAATEAEQLVIQLADGTTNRLADTASYAEDADVNAALFSAGDLTITGGGILEVIGNGNDGIASKDGTVVQSGTVTVRAKDDGLRGKDYVVADGGTITVTAGGDGVKADNEEDADSGYVAVAGGTLTLTTEGDGIDAATDLVTTGGTITVVSGGGHQKQPAGDVSAKGLKSGVITVLGGGTATVDASDDAVHSDGAVHLAGAKVSVASGDDGVHAEGQQIIDGGTVEVTAAVEGLEGAHIVLKSGTVTVTSSDDGVNGAGGTSTEENTGGGGRGGPGGGGPGGGGSEAGDYSVTVNGGTLVINSEGDGLDSNGTATITGGTVVVNGPQRDGNGALDVNGDFTISGGVLLAAGSAGMVVAPGTGSGQGWLSATLDSAAPAATTIQIANSDGDVVATFVTSKTVQNVVYSSSAVKSGDKYTIYTGGSASGASTGGLSASGSLGSAAEVATVTAGEAPAGGRGPR
ncbi:carbohydrate-binding domain-containing protein [Actinoplanes sp. GCM10030250]|uniref:carbohydrate-binding domain-containing protein n=1 Tax=Actinoplanes sp. GCM10030250 TaxID=3273376 RepID=UPI00360961B1